MRIKSCPVRVKAAGTNEGTDEGQFEAIVAAYNVDSVGDKILPGAFGDTLAEWKDSGDPIPVLWSHNSQDPDYHIGWVLEAEERDEGLWVKAQMDPDDLKDPTSKASKIYKLLKGRRVTQFSFAYDIMEGAWVEKADEEYYELRKLKLYEVGPTLIGANQSTELLDVKSGDRPVRIQLDGATPEDSAAIRKAVTAALSTKDTLQQKAERALSAKNEDRVKELARLATELLEAVQSSDVSDDEKAVQDRSVAPEEPVEAKEAQPTHPSPASLRLRAELEATALSLTLTD